MRIIFWDPGNTAAGVKAREKWLTVVLAAQSREDTPGWVQGDGPSPELMAQNGDREPKPEPVPKSDEDMIT